MLLKHNLVFPMTGPYNLEEVAVNNNRSLAKLNRAIALSQGQFSLILVRCNHPRLRESILKQLREQSPVEIQELFLHPTVNTLYTTIQTTLKDKQPQALILAGLESVLAIEQVLISTNLVRDEFRKQFHFPLVLWVSDEILQKLIRLAPDFKSWATSAIHFDVTNHQLIEWEERQRLNRAQGKHMENLHLKIVPHHRLG